MSTRGDEETMTWFDRTYEVDTGVLTTCRKCGVNIEAYTPRSLKGRKRAHKQVCRKRRVRS